MSSARYILTSTGGGSFSSRSLWLEVELFFNWFRNVATLYWGTPLPISRRHAHTLTNKCHDRLNTDPPTRPLPTGAIQGTHPWKRQATKASPSLPLLSGLSLLPPMLPCALLSLPKSCVSIDACKGDKSSLCNYCFAQKDQEISLVVKKVICIHITLTSFTGHSRTSFTHWETSLHSVTRSY